MNHAFLMIGQSNMAGRGFIGDVPEILNEQIKMLRNGRWQMMEEPINYDRSVSGVGLAASFAQRFALDNEGDTIGLIPCAEGGSSIAEWHIGGPLLSHAIEQGKLALKESQLAGIIWHQGESDAYNGNYTNYYNQLEQLFTYLRVTFEDSELPIIIGGLPDFLGKTGFGMQCVEYKEIDAELRRYADTHKHTYYVTAEGLEANPDGIHINARSQRIFGVRYYEAYKQQKHIDVPLEDEDKYVEALYTTKKPTVTEQIHLVSKAFALGQLEYDAFIQQYMSIQQGGHE